DGALSGVADYLQRIKELAVKAGNGLITNDDKKAIQSEIDQLKEGISNSASTTEYNGIKLLDGSRSSMQIISDGNGTSHELENVNSTLDALGIKDFSVMGNYDIGDIDKALEKVSNGRTQIGAQANGLESAFNYNSIASYNTTASKSRLSDTEYGEYVSKLQKETNLNTYKLMMQKKQQQNEASNIARIMTSI
ncbi:MAG TPA: flagellin FliC5, partial [Lachnospiraceae bacterium]|nr:flagellin FliC5 [Lachnospiraceae bacterium]